MQFEAAYDSVSRECIKAIDTKVTLAIENISETEIQQRKEYFLCDVRTGKKASNPISQLKTVHIKEDLAQYLLSDASDIVDYLKQIVVSEIALYHLMIEGKTMPIVWRNPQRMEINIEHSRGNSIIRVLLDLMPFESYMVIAPTQA